MTSSRYFQRFHDHLYRRLRWEELDSRHLIHLATLARDEDMAGLGLRQPPASPGDVSTDSLPANLPHGCARLTARQHLQVCGQGLVPLILEAYGGARWTPECNDGAALTSGQSLGLLEGPVDVLLKAERVLLNFLQHLSGVATQTRRFVTALGDSPTRLLDTRKTTPGFRMLEKYAVACGGGWNHRLGLFDRVMLKDNHLASSGSSTGERLAEAVRRARQQNPDLAIEVEVDHPDQIPPVLAASADVILLDNFSHEDIAQAVSLIGGRALTEASGGVSLQTLPALGQLGLDFVSCGALIHQSLWVDIGMDWQ